MNTTFTPEETAELVAGAQKFLAPAADPRDDERLTPPDKNPSIDHATND